MQSIVGKVSKEVLISAPIDLVWYAWTISERVSEWFAPQAIVDPHEGGAYELYFIPGNTDMMNTKGCKITQLKREEQLQFTWKGPDQFANLMNDEERLTVVKVEFNKIDEKTSRVVIEHSGFQEGDQWKEAIEWHKMAWNGVLDSLKTALEKGEGNLCCRPK
ncbi:SRPBCC domain-containing protein [Chungangia koreensis]|uniref:SRPBCC domain-containing protein n=1 Tax=Chungangia koreensis TaxID=752657 RepID=A0ABV8X4Q5_9LACT